jgi:hypothetical protein
MDGIDAEDSQLQMVHFGAKLIKEVYEYGINHRAVLIYFHL